MRVVAAPTHNRMQWAWHPVGMSLGSACALLMGIHFGEFATLGRGAWWMHSALSLFLSLCSPLRLSLAFAVYSPGVRRTAPCYHTITCALPD